MNCPTTNWETKYPCGLMESIDTEMFTAYNHYMDQSEKQTRSEEYLKRCRHPQIQALRPDSENAKSLWTPTSEQLHELLAQKLPYPDRSILRRIADGWEYETYFREWAADYGTYIDTHRQFVGTDAESVLLQVLMALLGIGERWMV